MNDPNSSKIVPVGVGNTNTPTGTRNKSCNKQDSCKKHWIITLKSSNSSINLKQWIMEHCDSAIWQLEKGNDTGYLHYQITLTLKEKKRLTWLKNHFSKTAHCEVVNNIDAAFDYSQKSDTRMAGPFYYPEPLNKPLKDPLEGKTYYKWQQMLIDIYESEADDRSIYWIYEPDGKAGKSSFCKHLHIKYGDEIKFADVPKRVDLMHYVTKGPFKALVIDIPRKMSSYAHNESLYTSLESIKNGFVFSGKYDSTALNFNYPHIFIFANVKPLPYSTAGDMSADKIKVWNIHTSINKECNLTEYEETDIFE